MVSAAGLARLAAAELGPGQSLEPEVDGNGRGAAGFLDECCCHPGGRSTADRFWMVPGFIQALLEAQAWRWFAKLVVIGELAVGAALILGAFTGIAAFLGGFMNWNFMMAGTASVNPVFFVIAVGLILAWKVSGFIGADYVLLPWLGTPWRRKAEAARAREAAALGAAARAPERRGDTV